MTPAPTLDLDRPAGQPMRPLVDPFARAITYLRVSVTDRCDFRCVYCMAENMTFLPKADLLTLEELDRLCTAFVVKGVRKLRLTGGEPLVRRGIMTLVGSLSRHLRSGALDELTLTTNGSQLAKYASELKSHGVERINVSLDTLDAGQVPRHHALGRDRQGARRHRRRAGRGAEGQDQRGGAQGRQRGRDCRPGRLGARPRHGDHADRGDAARRHRRGAARRNICRSRWCARGLPSATRSTTSTTAPAGPARYVRVKETGGRLGFITPMTHNFCESCNRVRITCTGTLYMCLGQEDAADLRAPLRASEATICCTPRSTKRSRASPRATISSSTAATSARRSPAI